MNDHILDSNEPAKIWEDGYALGCGRIGAVTMGDPSADRFAMNHDLLWRRYIKPGCADYRDVIPEFRKLWLNGEREKAVRFIKNRFPSPADTVYINALVPACDLTIKLVRPDASKAESYRRVLNMQEGIASVRFEINGKRYERESFCSSRYGLMVNHMTVEPSSSMSAEVILSRFPDHDCHVEGRALYDEIVLEGKFEEGVRFAVVTKLMQKGGRTTTGRRFYTSQDDQMAPCLNGFTGTGWRKIGAETFEGPSACVDSANDILILTAIVTSDETNGDLTEACRRRISSAPTDYEELKAEHIAYHKPLFDRVSLDLNGESELTVSELIKKKDKTTAEYLKLVQLQFDMARYLAISGSMPEDEGSVPRGPMGLQGIWNQEGRPLWDADYHMDLNLQMTYWPMNRLNLSEAQDVLLDWMIRMLPQAEQLADKMYGCDGACYGALADNFTLGGNFDFFGPGLVSAGNWLLQILWQRYEFTKDEAYLEKLYPIMHESAEFIAEYLIQDKNGRFMVCPSPSPEMRIWIGSEDSVVAENSSFDLELIHDLMENLIKANTILGKKDVNASLWHVIDEYLPWPRIGASGELMEWSEDHKIVEEGHRHRSHLVGVCPGIRINREDTPDLIKAARKALNIRRSYMSDDYYPSFSPVWDGQLFNRMGDGEAAWGQIKMLISDYPCAGLMLSHRKLGAPDGGWFEDHHLFQIEANIAAGAAISEFLVQDAGDVIYLLPTLPKDMACGKVSGLKMRNGFEVRMCWENGIIKEAEIISTIGGTCRWKTYGDGEVHCVDTLPGQKIKVI